MGFFNSFKKKSNDSSNASIESDQHNNLDENTNNEVEEDSYEVKLRNESPETEENNKNQINNRDEVDQEETECLEDTSNNDGSTNVVIEKTENQEDATITHEVINQEEETLKEESTAETDISVSDNNNESKQNTKIISILNQKGGVGKSTTAINLSAALGVLGKKCLLVDLDPQGNTSSGLGIEKNNINKCIYDVLLRGVDINEVIINDVVKGVDVVPATINLAGAEVELVSEIAREQRLKQALMGFKDKYDFIFIDCPPSLGLLTVNALVAADRLLIPIQCEFYALEGVTKLLDSMKRVKSLLNPELDIFGVVLTMYDNRTTLSKQVADEVCKFFGDKVFDSKIPRTVKISEAPSFGVPINEYEPLCKGAIMYESLAEEVINRG